MRPKCIYKYANKLINTGHEGEAFEQQADELELHTIDAVLTILELGLVFRSLECGTERYDATADTEEADE